MVVWCQYHCFCVIENFEICNITSSLALSCLNGSSKFGKRYCCDKLYASLWTNWFFQKLLNIEAIPIPCFGGYLKSHFNLTEFAFFIQQISRFCKKFSLMQSETSKTTQSEKCKIIAFTVIIIRYWWLTKVLFWDQ